LFTNGQLAIIHGKVKKNKKNCSDLKQKRLRFSILLLPSKTIKQIFEKHKIKNKKSEEY
jgi:hypothetical protein